jgi:nicotinate-nucleotide adenylyltransferase
MVAVPVTTVALFGGSFNPPHIAHQMVCLYVLETTPVDEVWMVPTYRHAFQKPLAPFDDRVAMCELAAAPFGGRVVVSDIEAQLDTDANRTLETIHALLAQRPDLQLRLVIGSDILAETAKWYRWSEIEKLAPPIVVGRAGHGPDPSPGPSLPDISSTEVRARIARGHSAVPLVSRDVMDYIAHRGLYA